MVEGSERRGIQRVFGFEIASGVVEGCSESRDFVFTKEITKVITSQ